MSADLRLEKKLGANPQLAGTARVGGANFECTRIKITVSCYPLKEQLKIRGYRWDSYDKCWGLVMNAKDSRAEVEWLKNKGLILTILPEAAEKIN